MNMQSVYTAPSEEEINLALKETFSKKSKIKWRCPSCRHFMDAFEKRYPKKLVKFLIGDDIGPRKCKKCRKESWAFLMKGRIVFLQVFQGSDNVLQKK